MIVERARGAASDVAASDVAASDVAASEDPLWGADARRLFATWEVALIGLGSIGTPLALYLANLGFRRFVLYDPKRHKAANVRTQCAEDEVGAFKVKAAAARLRAAGAERVIAWPSFVELVEPGWVGPDALVVVCGDRLSAVRAAHDVARTLDRPLVRINIEPRYAAATLSAWDYRRGPDASCALCSWGAREFAAQEHIVSCEPSDERPTGSPRALSTLAASQGALMIAQALTQNGGAGIWERSFVYSPAGPAFLDSHLPAAATSCLGDHSPHAAVVRLDETARALSFDALARQAGFDVDRAVVRGSGQVALAARCSRCGDVRKGCWWRRAPGPVARCACGGAVHGMPFWTLGSWRRQDIASHWERPLAELGVGRRALIEIAASPSAATSSASDDDVARWIVG